MVNPRNKARTGGRSARIQRAVHDAVHQLGGLCTRNEITVPQIAAAAGVTPSTIYRRWGDLPALLADVAVERLRPVSDPDDTGSVEGDLRAFVEQYAEEMSSPVGLALMRDVLATPDQGKPGACAAYTCHHLSTLNERALARGENPFDVDEVIDVVISPIIYRALFGDRMPNADDCQRLVDRVYSPQNRSKSKARLCTTCGTPEFATMIDQAP